MKTLLEVLNSGSDYLAKQGCDEARSVMQHLMAHVLQCNRTYLYTHFDQQLSEGELEPLRALLKRKANGEPLQHILGSAEFYRREFVTDSRALIPRPETEELVELVLKRIGRPEHNLKVLDMGTGSGVIGITLSLELKEKAHEVVLADISPSALSLALENAMKLGARVSTVETDLFSAFERGNDDDEIQAEGSCFDVIVANLPYIANEEKLQTEVNFDPASALYGGKEGWEVIGRFLQEAPAFLSENGFVALETGYDQADVVTRLMSEAGYRDVEILKDMNGVARFPFATCPLPTSE